MARVEELERLIVLQSLSLLNPHAGERRYDRIQIDAIVREQADARRAARLEETTIVAKDDDGDMLGFASLSLAESTICGLFVHPDFMRRGIGSLLLMAIEKIAISQRVKTLWVMSSIESIDFYRLNGYTFWAETGFRANDRVWIPCQTFRKELVVPSRVQILLQRLNLVS